MKLLMHTCCAPCSIMCIEKLREEGIEPTLYYHNPNIHPCKEYRLRKKTLIDYAKSVGAKLILDNEYGLRKFLQRVFPDYDSRCEKCYRMRAFGTAKYAAENGFDTFTTTLLISPYQNHELIIKACEDAAEEYGIEFLYRDFRPFFKEGQEKARELGLYMQNYCGCIFSEEDKYRKKEKEE